MNKEQQSINELRALVHSELDGTRMLDEYLKHCDTLQKLVDQQVILEEYNVTPEILREVLLTGQMFRNQPTLDECIKEWEDRGFKYIKFYNSLKFENKSEDITINIQEWNGSVMITDSNYCYARNITYDLHNLIHKTLKALEVENE